MISKTYTRKMLDCSLIETKFYKNYVVKYPMTKFRHAIFDCADKCRFIKDCVWEFDILHGLTICNLIFGKSYIKCSYNYKNNLVKVEQILLPRKNTVNTVNCDVDNLSEVVIKFQPKIKMLKKKV